MAGGFGSKFDPKGKNLYKNGSSSEVMKDSQGNFSSQKPPETPKFSLKGVLGLGQTVEFGKKQDKLQSWGNEFMGSFNLVKEQEKLVNDNNQRELEKQIQELRVEIDKLTKATENLEKDVENVAITPVVEFNEYQLNFLQRIRKFIITFRKNINEASCWLESFQSKKKKKNAFWNNVKNKKQGGEQYLFSNEHSASRSGA